MHDLDVREVMPQVAGTVPVEGCGHRVERFAHGRLFDGVGAHLRAGAVQPGDGFGGLIGLKGCCRPGGSGRRRNAVRRAWLSVRD